MLNSLVRAPWVGAAARYLNALAGQVAVGPINPARAGHPPFRDRAGDVVLVVDDAAVARAARAGRHSAVDWSWAWSNTILQEVGPFAALPPERMRLDGRRVAILTRSCADVPTADLEAWVQNGGALVVELPHPDLERLAGLRVESDPVPVQRITGVAEELLPAGASGRMRGFPIHGCRWDAAGDAEALIEIDGRPAVFRRRVGRGVVVGVALDYGAALVAWMQGVPDEDGSVRERRGCLPGVVESDDLVFHPRMLANPVPVANLFQRAVWRAAGELPGWWTIPEGKAGACMLTHDDEGMGWGPLEDVVGVERAQGFDPTVFYVAAPGASESGELHWNRYRGADGRRHPLAEQATWLGTARLNRTHYLDWGRSWDAPWRELSAAGLAADGTLGPNRGWGYLFGAGLPYAVLDGAGEPIPAAGETSGLWEIPFHAQEDWGGVTAAALEEMLGAAAAADHTGVVLLFHADKALRTAAGREMWGRVMERARALDLWRGSLREWEAFHRARAETALRGTAERGTALRGTAERVECGGAGWVRLPAADTVRRVWGRSGAVELLVRRPAPGVALVRVDGPDVLTVERAGSGRAGAGSGGSEVRREG